MSQDWSHVPHGPSVGDYAAIIIVDETVCRDCTKESEEIGARRGINDVLSWEEAAARGAVCSRCDKPIKKG